MRPQQTDQGPKPLDRLLAALAPVAGQLPDIQLDARQVLLDKRPFSAGLQQLHDPVARAEPNLRRGGRGTVRRARPCDRAVSRRRRGELQ
jgi:hypothetical protein